MASKKWSLVNIGCGLQFQGRTDMFNQKNDRTYTKKVVLHHGAFGERRRFDMSK